MHLDARIGFYQSGLLVLGCLTRGAVNAARRNARWFECSVHVCDLIYQAVKRCWRFGLFDDVFVCLLFLAVDFKSGGWADDLMDGSCLWWVAI